jgi:acyl-lipid omega-6 desaturase (Delta-12 desaturase)
MKEHQIGTQRLSPVPDPSRTLLGAPKIADIKASIPDAMRQRSIGAGMKVFIGTYLLWLVAFAAMLLAPEWWSKLLAGTVVALAAGMLFVVAHDAAHGALTPKPALNRWLARLAFAPGLQPMVSWEYSHNVLHHGWTNLRGRDPVYAPLTKAEYDVLPRWRRFLERVYRSLFGVALLYLIEIWWKLEIAPGTDHRKAIDARGSFRFDGAVVAVFICVQVAAILGLSTLPDGVGRGNVSTVALLVGTSVLWPYAVFFWILGFLTFQHHTHPRVAWYNDQQEWNFYRGQIQGTVHIKFPWPIEFLLHDIMDHNAHHVDPKIPLYHVARSQTALETAYGSHVITERWTPAYYWRLCRTCQLYDYDSKRWVGFDGRFTSDTATCTM